MKDIKIFKNVIGGTCLDMDDIVENSFTQSISSFVFRIKRTILTLYRIDMFSRFQ